MKEQTPADNAQSNKITARDVLRALFLYEQDTAQSPLAADKELLASELTTSIEQPLEAATPDSIRSISYETSPLRILDQPNTRRTLISGIGIILIIAIAYSAQSLIASQSNSILAGAVYAVASVMWLAILAFE